MDGVGKSHEAGFSTKPIGSNFKLTCNSWDENSIFRRTLNAMLVASSDGNAYAIACDHKWRWSKCLPLEAGLTFTASREEDRLTVRGVKGSRKELEAGYKILVTRSLE